MSIDHPAKACCTVCHSTEFLQENHGAGGLDDVCRPCFCIWYDGVGPREDGWLRGEDIPAFDLKARAAGTWCFDSAEFRLAT